MKNKITKIFAICLICLTLFSISAFATTSYQGYNVDVPKLNGSATTTTQTKTKTGYSGNIETTRVGGGKKVDCRMKDTNNNDEGAWLNNMKSGDSGTLLSRASHAKGHAMCVRFSNKLTTLVDVNTSGRWRADS